jgi:hypothetical protein
LNFDEPQFYDTDLVMHGRSRLTSPLEEIERLLTNQGADLDLNRLVKRGCDRRMMLYMLAFIRNPQLPDDIRSWTGQPHRQIRAFAEQLRRCARKIDELHARHLFAVALRETGSADLLELPDTLRRYASRLVSLSKQLRRPRLSRHLALANLVREVIARTGKPRDDEVAAVVAAATGRSYFTDAHKRWRSQHYRQLEPLIVKTSATWSASAPPKPQSVLLKK